LSGGAAGQCETTPAPHPLQVSPRERRPPGRAYDAGTSAQLHTRQRCALFPGRLQAGLRGKQLFVGCSAAHLAHGPRYSRRSPTDAHTKSERSPQWSSDGKKLAFLSNRAGKTQVYVMDADGGAAMAVTDRTDRFKGRGRRGCVRSAGGVRNRGRSRRRRHSPRKGAYNIDMFTRLLEWYDRHLPGAALETQSGSIENQIHVLSIQLADLGLVRVGSCPGEDSN
jgi:hypothetical protein